MGGVAVLRSQSSLKDHIPMKSRTTIKFNPNLMNPPSRTSNFTLPDSRRRTPPKGILKKNVKNAEAVATDSPAATSSKNLVMGQVKILKRGENLNVLKELNDRKVSNGAASTTPKKDLVADRDDSQAVMSRRRALRTKKKAEKHMKMLSESKSEDVALSSTHRLGPDPEIVSKHIQNVTEGFAGYAFSDSPPPSSVPLPGFVSGVKNDATTDLRKILGLRLLIGER